MAISFSFDGLSARLHLRSKQVVESAEILIRRVAVAMDQALVMTTPVDTGRARGNWVTSIGRPQEFIAQKDQWGEDFPLPQEVIAQGQATIAGWHIGRGPIFIANSVPYIVRLEHGWSKQAPQGMLGAAVKAAQAQIAGKKLLQE
jgi:hypothetical protein